MLGFILRLAGAKGFRQVIPELEEPRVQHFQYSADVTRALLIEIKSRGGCVVIFCIGSLAVAVEKFHCHERIEKIENAARMQTKFAADVRAREPAIAELGEKIKVDRSEKGFGIPKTESGL